MIDNYAKNNIDWTENHVSLFEKNGITNIVNVLVQCKHLVFPTSERITKAEKELAALERRKNTFYHNTRRIKTKKRKK